MWLTLLSLKVKEYISPRASTIKAAQFMYVCKTNKNVLSIIM